MLGWLKRKQDSPRVVSVEILHDYPATRFTTVETLPDGSTRRSHIDLLQANDRQIDEIYDGMIRGWKKQIRRLREGRPSAGKVG